MSTAPQPVGKCANDLFYVLRGHVDLAELVRRHTELKPSGRTMKGRCPHPEHPDPDPSFYVYPDGRFYCFGCRWHGDVVDLWAAMKGLKPGLEAALDLAQEYNVKLPEQDPEAERKAEERRRYEAKCMREAQERHKDLERHPHVRDWWRSRGFDETLWERYLLGATADGRAATIPYWHRGRVLGIVRRKLEGEPKYLYPKAEEFPGGCKPLFVPGQLRLDTCVVEGIIDALALDALGENAVAIGGTHPNEAQLRELKELTGDLRILPDNDDAGKKAAKDLARKLYPNAKVCPAVYGEGIKDAADLYATKRAEEALEVLSALKRASEDLIDIEVAAAKKLDDSRHRLNHAVKHIIPLVCELGSEATQEAELTIAANQLEGVNKGWLTKALKEEQEHREAEKAELLQKLFKEMEERTRQEYQAKVEVAQPEIDNLFKPGVLRRFREDAAEMHGVVGDEKTLELVALVALGAQLKPLPNGRPIGRACF